MLIVLVFRTVPLTFINISIRETVWLIRCFLEKELVMPAAPPAIFPPANHPNDDVPCAIIESFSFN